MDYRHPLHPRTALRLLGLLRQMLGKEAERLARSVAVLLPPLGQCPQTDVPARHRQLDARNRRFRRPSRRRQGELAGQPPQLRAPGQTNRDRPGQNGLDRHVIPLRKHHTDRPQQAHHLLRREIGRRHLHRGLPHQRTNPRRRPGVEVRPRTALVVQKSHLIAGLLHETIENLRNPFRPGSRHRPCMVHKVYGHQRPVRRHPQASPNLFGPPIRLRARREQPRQIRRHPDLLRRRPQVQQRLATRLRANGPRPNPRVVLGKQLPGRRLEQPVHPHANRIHRQAAPDELADLRTHRLKRIRQPLKLAYWRIADKQPRRIRHQGRQRTNRIVAVRRRVSPPVPAALRQHRNIQNHITRQELPELLSHQLIADVTRPHPVADLD